MIAMQLTRPRPVEARPLTAVEAPRPTPGRGELLVRVKVCGVCHTDLHTVEGELNLPKLPLIPGHQVVGMVEQLGDDVNDWRVGERVGIAWLHETCGRCRFCASGAENLCLNARFTGLHADGGFAQFATVPANFAYRVPDSCGDAEAAPLLCAGIVGYRALKRSGARAGRRLGLYGFGASAHIAIQIAIYWGCEVYVFTRSANHQALARELGAAWVGRAEENPPAKLDSAVIYAPAGPLVREALRALDKNGTLSLAGIYMTPVPELDYEQHLYHEKTITSVANATREDGRELLRLAGEIPVRTTTETFPLADANEVLRRLKESRIEASAVLEIP